MYDTEDEAFSEAIPANFSPIPGQNVVAGQPLIFDIDQGEPQSSLPLCLVFNARSIFNKSDNLREMLHQYGPDICLVSESFERPRKRIKDALNSRQFKSISYFRKNRAPGGGAAIIYNESRFSFLDLNVPAAENIECAWALCTPKHSDVNGETLVKRIAVASYYISPKARNKQDIVEHIIDTIHTLRAQYDNDVNFLIGGDFNRTDISDILDCYGALKQICSVPTRNTATLEIVLTDLHTLFHPPTTLPPLQADTGKGGKDSDHNVVLLAPKNNKKYKVIRVKKIIKTRPLPESQIVKFEHDLALQPWDILFLNKTVDAQVELFHDWLRSNLDNYFPEKTTKLSTLDKKWMSPHLKQIHRAMSREYYRNKRSPKYKKLKSKFKKLKRKSVQTFYLDFVHNLII